MKGWIKIHRQFLNWQWFNKSEAVHLFLYLVLKANHKDGNWQGIPIKKGQFITSFGKISSDTGISIQSIRTLMKKFNLTNEINIQTTNKYSIITICKYDIYQDEEIESNNQLTNNQQTTNKQLTTNKNDKNNKEVFKAPTIDEIQLYCKQRNNNIDVNKFYDFYESKGWYIGKNKMKDWKASIRTWENTTTKQQYKSPEDKLLEYVKQQTAQYDTNKR